MANRPVALTVHKNTKDKRHRQFVAKRMRDAIREVNDDKQCRGYALIAWTDEYDGRADWHFDKVESSRSTPERVKQILLNAMAENRGA